MTIQKFDLSTRKTDKALEGVTRFALSANGEKMLYLQGENWMLAEAGKPPAAGEGTLKLGTWRVYVDPRAEWKQMYREAWRLQRDFFYDPGFHGLDLAAAEKKYAAMGRASQQPLRSHVLDAGNARRADCRPHVRLGGGFR
jgi:tricorn protease